MLCEKIPLPDDFSGKVRLFPLPELVHFPQVLLPLHIFEPRYCQMLHEAMQTDRLITMATLQSTPLNREAIANEVCIGMVVAHEAQADGTHDIVLAGVERATIDEELPSSSLFRRARVEIPEDSTPPEQQIQSELVESLLHSFARESSSMDRIRSLVDEEEIDLATLTDLLAYYSQFPTEFKLSLLNEADCLKRARLMLRGLGKKTVESFPPPFSPN